MLSVESKGLQLYNAFRLERFFRVNQENIRHSSQEQYQNMPVYHRCKAISDSQ